MRSDPARGLTREGFEALLDRLDPDRERAGKKYETIRRKLVRLFAWRGCEDPESLADEAITRVARRAAEGLEFQSSDPYRYFCGVAHLVFKEVLRERTRERRALERGDWPPPGVPEDAEDEDRRLGSLRRCLERLPPESRRLILFYHRDDGGGRIDTRKRIAEEMGIPINALRIRAHRIRQMLESCVEGFLRP